MTSSLTASVFTHLLEDDAIHYLRETRRVLRKEGTFVVSLHSEVAPGEHHAGDEVRIDVKPAYFDKLARSAGLTLHKSLGSLLGQDLLLFG